MESGTKRIVAIALIAVIGIGIGVTAWVFLSQPSSGIKYPGAPSTRPNTFLIGAVGDIGELAGDGNYEGAYFAAKEINEAGGVDVGGETYYIGITKEDTDEENPQMLTSRGIAAARRLIFDKEIDYAIGGFRSEVLSAYIEEFMDEEILFLGTGAAEDIHCQNVIDDYDHYKYFIRCMPINSTALGTQILSTFVGLILTMQATYGVGGAGYGTHDVVDIGILAEDLGWTIPIVGMIQAYLAPIVAGYGLNINIITPILYDISLTATDMNTHLQSLQSDGADIVIPAISAQGGVLMMQQYNLNEYDYLIFGIDVQAQLNTFWETSGESAGYETQMQAVHRTNKTALTIGFWDAFIDYYGHEPIYNAVGAYDAIHHLVAAIEATDSLDTLDIIEEWETWTVDNTRVGVSGDYAWYPASHELVGFEGLGKGGYGLWTQWLPDGTKIVISGFGTYDDSITTGTFTIPPWVHTEWTT